MSDHAQHRFHGGEGVIGNLGFCGGAAGDQSGLAGVGLGQQTDIGQELELQPKYRVVALGRRTGPSIGSWLVDDTYRALPPTSLTALGNQHRIVRNDIGHEVLAAVPVHPPDDRTQGHADLGILAVGAALVLALTVGSALQVEGAVELQVQQRVEGGIANDVCAAAIAAIAAVGSAAGQVLEPQKTDAPVATVPGLNVDSYSIDHRSVSKGNSGNDKDVHSVHSIRDAILDCLLITGLDRVD